MKKLAKQQPKDGDIIVHCGHTEYPSIKWEWFYVGHDDGISFTRPDGSTGRAKWIVPCLPCIHKYDDPMKVPMRGDGIWMLNHPAVYEKPFPGAP